MSDYIEVDGIHVDAEQVRRWRGRMDSWGAEIEKRGERISQLEKEKAELESDLASHKTAAYKAILHFEDGRDTDGFAVLHDLLLPEQALSDKPPIEDKPTS